MNLLRRLRNRILKTIRWDLENHNSIKITSESFISPLVTLRNTRIRGLIKIDEGCKIVDGVRIDAESEVNIGRYTSIMGPNTDIKSSINAVNIGAFCSIARNVAIQEFNHKIDNLTTYHIHQNIFNSDREKDIYSKGTVEIGNDVWIGTQCLITSGAKIGDGAVIGANSVVVGDIPAFAVAVGSPAKVIKYRFDEVTRNKIKNLKWWYWDIEKIKSNPGLFENIEELKDFIDE